MGKYALLLLWGFVGSIASLSVAAPVPAVNKEAKKKELEALWAELYKDEPAATTAAIKLFKQPDHTVAFLKEKLRPLKLDALRCRQLLNDLGSGDEKKWKAAWNELDYLDPRLAIDLPTLMNEVTAKPSRTRMVELCSDREADSLIGQDVQPEWGWGRGVQLQVERSLVGRAPNRSHRQVPLEPEEFMEQGRSRSSHPGADRQPRGKEGASTDGDRAQGCVPHHSGQGEPHAAEEVGRAGPDSPCRPGHNGSLLLRFVFLTATDCREDSHVRPFGLRRLDAAFFFWAWFKVG